MKLLEKLFFKKVELWVVGLIILLSIVTTVMFAAVVRHRMLGNRVLEPVGMTALRIAAIPENIKRLLTDPSPVLVGEKGRFPDLSGWTPTLTKFESGNSLGLLLLSRYDGDQNNWVVELIDLNQQLILHQWKSNTDHSFYGRKSVFDPADTDARSFTHPLLNQDGSIIATDLLGITRAVDSCADLVWHTELIKGPAFHHSIEKDVEGYLWIPSRIYPQTLPGVGSNFKDDAITKLSSTGKVLLRRSVSQILIDNGYRYLIFGSGSFTRDPIHLNDIQPVNSDGQFWKKGDLFLSLRHQSMIMLYRPSTNEIIWKQQGPWNHQHDVDILNDHQISVFDNNANSTDDDDKVIGHNQVMIYDFETNETTSPYKSALAMNDVRTVGAGRSEIYPNGDIFIEETENGRLLRITPDGQVVWQYVNRATDGHIFWIQWSRIIKAEKKTELTNFLQDLDCGA